MHANQNRQAQSKFSRYRLPFVAFELCGFPSSSWPAATKKSEGTNPILVGVVDY